jgi:hypothetical protein
METNYTADTGEMRANRVRTAPKRMTTLDGRTREAKRAEHWRVIFTALITQTIGAERVDELMKLKIRRAAQATAIAERARVAALASDDADVLRTLQRAERLAESAVEAMGYPFQHR